MYCYETTEEAKDPHKIVAPENKKKNISLHVRYKLFRNIFQNLYSILLYLRYMSLPEMGHISLEGEIRFSYSILCTIKRYTDAV
jgi:hypothetical protein